ncbi:hypothetical protein [Kistimonas asteriae]|uniref:hypothetical protein n=1 Tax=Kistimonas asteriae TaxID=517724 RepID=UPI001BADC137|nr:hypothetical protein [Kistimonas asteriae]
MPLIDKSNFIQLEDLFHDILNFEPITLKPEDKQNPMHKDFVFTVHKSGDQYMLTSIVDSLKTMVAPDGDYLFVVLTYEAFTIYCAPNIYDYWGSLQGHTSLAMRESVRYAGHMKIAGGTLTQWSNASGHYKPPEALHQSNLNPYLRTLLPAGKFTNYVFYT